MDLHIINPLLHPFQTTYGVYPFSEISTEHFRPAFSEALREKKEEVDAIINNIEEPTFQNTILALENCGALLEQVGGIFFNLLHSSANDELMAISEEIIPELSELSNYISLSEKLFNRIKSVYETRESLDLDEEDHRLLWRCYEGFRDGGALLPKEKKEELRTLSRELSELTLAFGQNVLRDEKNYTLHITEDSDIEGLPEAVIEAAAHKAQEKDLSGWLFDLTAPSYGPFLQYARRRNFREEIYRAKMAVATKASDFNNEGNIIQIVNKRRQAASLLGFNSFARSVLDDRMAKTPENVYELLEKLLKDYKPAAQKELQEIEDFARKEGFDAPRIEPWDWSYWAEQYKQHHYDLDGEMMRPYFELSAVIRGVFDLANRLYGITFRENKSLPVYHHDVKCFEAIDENNEFLGILYTDFFPREGKQSGAWMSNFQDQYHLADGTDHRPHITLVMNFTPPTKDKPSLLRAGEVGTFLHEFGHALHGLLSRCRYSSLSGTSVVRDFVELPSQLMENWLTEPEWLNTFARHYQTSEPMPEELIDKFIAARNYLTAYATCRQLGFGFLDLAYHNIEENLAADTDIKRYEDEAWRKTLVLPPSPEGAIMSTSFGHIFSGGYAAGYYGYKWSEVLDADAFSVFKEHGIFNREVANNFRRNILERGDTAEPMDLYRAFRGKEPSIEALERRDGIRI